MIEVADKIETSGFPLGFCFRREGRRPDFFSGKASQAVFRVDSRAMGAHQKEALVYEGVDGPVWRVVSDEGAYLKGSDCAPFPLGFFNAGLQADVLGNLQRIVRHQKLNLSTISLELDNDFSFSGSFFKGDGEGTAESAQLRLKTAGEANVEQLKAAVNEACRASIGLDVMARAQEGTFAIYVNGIRRDVLDAKPSGASDAPDPLKNYAGLPSPIRDGLDIEGIVTKYPRPDVETQIMPSAGTKFEIRVLGESTLPGIANGPTKIKTALKAPPGSHFGFGTDEYSLVNPVAPSGLSLLCSAVSFCYMTQLLRYSEYLKYKVRAIRLVQYSPFSTVLENGMLVGKAGPFDTHLFLHGEEPDSVMQKLLVMAARTCYLHAALRSTLPPILTIEHNGVLVAR
jgi:hypothetical protein